MYGQDVYIYETHIIWQLNSAMGAVLFVVIGFIYTTMIYLRIKTKDRMTELPMIMGVMVIVGGIVYGVYSWASFAFVLSFSLFGVILGGMAIKSLYSPLALEAMGVKRAEENEPKVMTIGEHTVTYNGYLPW